MKRILLSLLMIPFIGVAQNQFSYGFDATPTAMTTAGWVFSNQSSPLGASVWSKSTYTVPLSNPVFGSGNTTTVPVGQAGGANSFMLVNFNSTTGAGTISNWLITPDITVQNGDIVTFYARKGTDGTQDYPDRLELRMSSATPTVLPSSATNVGSFLVSGVTVNPTLAGNFVFPKVWTQYSYTVSGLTGPTAVKFGFRYFVTDGGPSGNNSDLIGLDSFSVDRPLSTESFAKNNFAVYPNPVADVVNIANLNGLEITSASITDINGRVVKQVNAAVEAINVADLSSGVYFLKVTTTEGAGISKFVKR